MIDPPNLPVTYNQSPFRPPERLAYLSSSTVPVTATDKKTGPGDFAVMAPGHDAWVVGDEPCVVIDWQGYADYAKR